MKWELAIVAGCLLGVAAISRALAGSPVTAAMLFVSVGVIVGPLVLDGVVAAAAPGTGPDGAATETARIRLRFTSPAKPAVITPVPGDPAAASDIPGFRYLVVPQRLR